MCQRKCDVSKVICSICAGVYKKILFYRHEKVCKTPKKTTVPRPVTAQTSVATNSPPMEREVVLNSMDEDRLHDIIKSDDLIMQIGKDIYDSRKPAKGEGWEDQGKDRRLARLVEATERVTKAEEMFVVSNVYLLEQGIHNTCQTGADSEKQSKEGLKAVISSLMRVAAKNVIANFIITNRINDSTQVGMFFERF